MSISFCSFSSKKKTKLVFWGFEPKCQRCEALVRLREVMTWTSFNRADYWKDEPIRWQSQDNCDCDCNRSFMTASEFYWVENQSRKNIAPRLHCCRVCLSTVSHWCVTLCLICITQGISCSSLQLIPPESNSYHLAHLETISISSSVRLAEGRSSVSSTVTQGSEHVSDRQTEDLSHGRVSISDMQLGLFSLR